MHHLIEFSLWFCEMGTIIIPKEQMKKLRCREVQ